MTSVLGYARTYFIGGRYWPDPLPDLAAEIGRFHSMVAALAAHLESGDTLQGITPAQLLQGPFSDAMTHAGQLALLRRLAGTPVPPENFIVADVSSGAAGTGSACPAQPRPRYGPRRRPAGRHLRRLRSPYLITLESWPYHSGVVAAPLRSRCGHHSGVVAGIATAPGAGCTDRDRSRWRSRCRRRRPSSSGRTRAGTDRRRRRWRPSGRRRRPS